MEIEISKTVTVKETINVDFPYYFKIDNGGDEYDCMCIGQILESGAVIQVSCTASHDNNCLEYGLIIENDRKDLSYYLSERYKCDSSEFYSAVSMLISEIGGIENFEVIKSAGYKSVSQLMDDIDSHKRKYNEILRHRSETLVLRADGFSKIVDMPEKFEKMYPFSQHSIKNKSDAYIGFMMAVDYFTNQAFKK